MIDELIPDEEIEFRLKLLYVQVFYEYFYYYTFSNHSEMTVAFCLSFMSRSLGLNRSCSVIEDTNKILAYFKEFYKKYDNVYHKLYLIYKRSIINKVTII